MFGQDAYAYGLALLDAIFSKEELSKSLLFQSKKKTTRVPLDPKHVSLLLSKLVQKIELFAHTNSSSTADCLDIKYKDKYDLITFTQKANQKCRDTKFVGLDAQEV